LAVLLCWVTPDFELYAAFDPLADKVFSFSCLQHFANLNYFVIQKGQGPITTIVFENLKMKYFCCAVKSQIRPTVYS